YVYAYEPSSCSFVSVESEDPAAEFIAVFECWATDLLALFRGRISPTAIDFARHREWNASPETFPFSLNRDLFAYAHPLRHPQRYLELYRQRAAALSPAPPRIRHA